MRIRMLKTRRGSPDGFKVIRYHEGVVYDLPDTLARSFLRDGWAYNMEMPDDISSENWRLSCAEIRDRVPNQALANVANGTLLREAKGEI